MLKERIETWTQRARLAARILRNGNAPASVTPDRQLLPGFLCEPLPLNAATLTNAKCCCDFYGIARSHLDSLGILSGRMAELGGSVDCNACQQFPGFDYTNIDITPAAHIPTLAMDVCKPQPLLAPAQFDFIFSQWVFEHLAAPWNASNLLIHLLKPGGLVVIATAFAWRYHPVPEDYWRFTPQALRLLFEGLQTIEAAFSSGFRRRNDRGFYPNGSDAVPLDEYGGWLENWAVFFVGRRREQ